MKIIQVSNFDLDIVSDVLIAENIAPFVQNKLLNFLNNTFSGPDSPYFYKLVEDDYELYKYNPL